ncbi:fatty acyl-CoA reductase wat-like [Chelonus insularis]|uniref:fatty acyl-CoA reductase wat-like n=1 Tax=Chelonus insularis TaxID=460826 RepID=UPI00158D2A14|nr:fatty acyl-CoA reductase wat-like [Chelonus insularis]
MTLMKDRGEMEKMRLETENGDVEEISEITEFFNGCNVLVTGGSGFVGKLLVEKLLRACPKLQTIYLLIRLKKGKSPKERFKEHFEDPLYDRLKSEQPDYTTRVTMIEGSIEDKGLVLAPETRERLKNTHVVFHAAATVRFDDKLRFAANINVRGTRDILLFAREMPNLKAFVHIGTAFSMCVTKFIDEIFYKATIGADDLLTIVDILDDPTLEYLTPKLIADWPNTYAFTKTVAEDAVLKHSKGLPVCIVRPAIMISTAHEPVPGWINNLYGPTGVTIGAGMGLLRTLHCDTNCIADIIPADYVINNIIAAAWDIGTRRRMNPSRALSTSQQGESNESSAELEEEKPPIYNCVSSCQKPITWGEYMKYNEIYGMNIPSISVLWYYFFTLNKLYWVHLIYVYLFHMIPAVLVDSVLWIIGKKPMLLKIYKKIHKFMHVISYFAMQQWKFRNDNVLKLWDKLSPVDKELYQFNVSNLEWNKYFWDYIRGLRIFIIKDPLETIPEGKKRYSRLKALHYTSLTVGGILLLWLVYFLLTTLVSFLLYFCPYFNKQ